MKAKRNLFAVLGWIVWKVLALFGVRYAKNQLADHEQSRRSRGRKDGSRLSRLLRH